MINNNINIGVVGLGLIGGSVAKAYKNTDNNNIYNIYGFDADEAILSFAKLSGVIDGFLNIDNNINKCEALFIALNPDDALEYLEREGKNIAENTLVTDCCGVKRVICGKCFKIAEKHNFIFVGGHPMAGSHNAGFKNSRENLFKGASMVLVPPVYDDAVLFGRIEELLKPLGFGRLTVTTAEKHDEIIAFSSQMAHIVSNAYIKSPAAKKHKGLSAGSYKDLTRVARLNPDMWSQLCMANRDFLTAELDFFIKSLKDYRTALVLGDINKLKELLGEGSRLKEELD
ncbi:MAG: prephenate dehydrogenase [Oscillospiraceae bacterium]|nr:prephenate dehydrogenase [Oscillospiraceae bacterium]